MMADLEILKWVYSLGYIPSRKLIMYAAFNNRIDILNWLYELNPIYGMIGTAKFGQIEILKCLHEIDQEVLCGIMRPYNNGPCIPIGGKQICFEYIYKHVGSCDLRVYNGIAKYASKAKTRSFV